MMMMMMFSLSKKELLALDINLAEAPPWFQMMLAFRDVADAQSGLCLFMTVSLHSALVYVAGFVY